MHSGSAGTRPPVDRKGDIWGSSIAPDWLLGGCVCVVGEGPDLISKWAVGVFPTEMIKSQVEHSIAAPVQRRLLVVLDGVEVVFAYRPVVPAQTIQGADRALKQQTRV